jgi:hypothetical protein
MARILAIPARARRRFLAVDDEPSVDDDTMI